MATLVDLITRELGDNAISTVTRQLGTDQRQANTALSAAIPVLISALARNTASAEGASSLSKALSRDHDGSILQDVASSLSNPNVIADGAGILRHVLGDRRTHVESALGRSTGLDSSKTAQLLQMLAPLILGALGKLQRERSLGQGGVADVLQREQKQMAQSAPDLMGMVGSLLDANQDGSVVDDVLRIGLDSLFGKKS